MPKLTNTFTCRKYRPRQRLRHFTMAMIACLGISACSTTPFLDSRREAGTLTHVITAPPGHVSVCYNASYSTPEEVQEVAQTGCDELGGIAKLKSSQPFECRLFFPTRAIFECVGGEQKPFFPSNIRALAPNTPNYQLPTNTPVDAE